ncbi:MAG: RIP metalloprotease RseP [Lachnospiraceae bacterium]|nr:RIP metalloprotease RseP [Lachnospiraceae bacterium]
MSIVFAVIIFGLLVFIHEFGHFIIAKKNGVRVVEFSIGMGPTLFSFGKGETKYSLKLLPFGGACQMLNKELAGEEDSEMDMEKSFESKSVWSRMAIIFAGPLFNFVLAFLFALIVIGYAGYDPAVITHVEEGSAADEAGLKKGDIIVEYDGSDVDLGREVYLEQYINGVTAEEIEIVYERDGKEYTTTLKPKYVEKYMMGIEYVAAQGENMEISNVIADGPCEAAGVKAGDTLKSINGTEIADAVAFNAYIEEHPLGDEAIHLVFDRNGEKVEMDVTPVLGLQSYETGFNYNTTRVEASALDTIKYSFIEVKYQIETVFKSLGMLFTGDLGVNDFTGPVGIVDAIDSVYEESQEDGAWYVFLNLANFTILLSANLGVMNLLPIPGLDGGRLVFLIIEAFRGKPVKHEEYINVAGMLLLMLFALYILFKDIINLF